MFVKTISASEFRENIKENLELLKEQEVLQIIHRGNGIKVAMTQQYFFNLLQKAQLFDELEHKNIHSKKLFQK